MHVWLLKFWCLPSPSCSSRSDTSEKATEVIIVKSHAPPYKPPQYISLNVAYLGGKPTCFSETQFSRVSGLATRVHGRHEVGLSQSPPDLALLRGPVLQTAQASRSPLVSHLEYGPVRCLVQPRELDSSITLKSRSCVKTTWLCLHAHSRTSESGAFN